MVNSDTSLQGRVDSPFNAKRGEGVAVIGVMLCMFMRLTCCCSSDLKTSTDTLPGFFLCLTCSTVLMVPAAVSPPD